MDRISISLGNRNTPTDNNNTFTLILIVSRVLNLQSLSQLCKDSKKYNDNSSFQSSSLLTSSKKLPTALPETAISVSTFCLKKTLVPACIWPIVLQVNEYLVN